MVGAALGQTFGVSHATLEVCVEHPCGDGEETIKQISLKLREEVGAKVKSIFHGVRMMIDSPRHMKGVSVDGEERTGEPQCKRLGRNKEFTQGSGKEWLGR